MTTPTRTPDQRAAALEKANRIRSARAELKRYLKRDRELDVIRLIVADPGKAALEVGRELEPVLGFRPPGDWLDSMAVYALLLACPSIGAVKARRLIRDAWGHLTSTTRRVGGMTEHQRRALAGELERDVHRRRERFARPATAPARA